MSKESPEQVPILNEFRFPKCGYLIFETELSKDILRNVLYQAKLNTYQNKYEPITEDPNETEPSYKRLYRRIENEERSHLVPMKIILQEHIKFYDPLWIIVNESFIKSESGCGKQKTHTDFTDDD